jgi:hypothetical protein
MMYARLTSGAVVSLISSWHLLVQCVFAVFVAVLMC